MGNLPAQRRQRTLLPELADLMAGFPSWASLRPSDVNVMRLEDELKDGSYEVRAELPGIDPAADVDVTVRDGRLTIKAERSEKKESNGRSEFGVWLVRPVGSHSRKELTRTRSRRPTTRAS